MRRVGHFIGFLKKQMSQQPNLTSNFTPRALQTLGLARKEAERLHHDYVGTEHLLLGLIILRGGVATNVLLKLGLSLEKVHLETEKYAGDPADQMLGHPYTPRAKRVLEMAKEEAKVLGHTYIGTEHLLLGLLHEKEGLAADIFKKFKIDMEQVRTAIFEELNPNFSPGDESQKT